MDDNTKDIEKIQNQINMINDKSNPDRKEDDHIIYIDSLTDNHIQKELGEDTLKVNKIEELNEQESPDEESNTKKIDKIDEIYDDNNELNEHDETEEEKKEESNSQHVDQPNQEIVEEPRIIKEKENYTVYYLIIVFLAIILTILLYFLFK